MSRLSIGIRDNSPAASKPLLRSSHSLPYLPSDVLQHADALNRVAALSWHSVISFM